MSEQTLRREQAGAVFKDAGRSYKAITPATLRWLRTIINQRMKDSGLIRGSFRCRQRGVIKRSRTGRFFAGITCRAFYFDDREAVSFNDDGFIGFAGWADNENVQPILRGFCDWVKEISNA